MDRELAGCEPDDATYKQCENDLQRIGWLCVTLEKLRIENEGLKFQKEMNHD